MSEKRAHPTRLVSLWPLLLGVLLFAPGFGGFPYPSAQAQYSDLVISHYPNAVFLKNALLDGSLPGWSPTILSGYPFAANPLSGLWYPPGWLALLFPLPLGFNVLIALHLLWGGLGMYLLLRAEGLSHRASLAGALAFEWMPKVLAHWGAGHLTLAYAVPWTPWLLASIYPSGAAALRWFARPVWLSSGLMLALIFLADPRWAAFAGLLWLAYGLARRPFLRQTVRESLIFVFSQLGLAALLSAPLLLPLLEYTMLSTRASLSAVEALFLSLPPARLLGLLFPDWGGTQEWILYPGGVVLVLGLVAIFEWRPRPQKRFWLGAGLLALVFSLGSSIPGLAYLVRLPGFDLLRVPSRALFVTGMALAALAAYGVEVLLKAAEIQTRRRVNLGLTALMAFAGTLAAGFVFLAPEFPFNVVWGAALIALASLGVWAILGGWLSTQTGLVLLLGLAILDGVLMNTSVLSFHPPDQVLGEQSDLAGYLADQPGDFRVYSPSYSLPQQTAARFGLELADGIDPLQLAAYTDFMDAATGVPRLEYSVTLPPYASGDAARDNAAYQPDAALLGLLNVRFVAAEFDLAADGLVFQRQFGETRLYENALARPRAWVQPEGAGVETSYQSATILERRPNRIRVAAEGPGWLVLSEIGYPGWRVSVDGAPAEVETAFGLLRSVQLPPGAHEVRFTFHPARVYLGLLGFLMGCAGWVVWARREKGSATNHG